jgi:hypothetical protein
MKLALVLEELPDASTSGDEEQSEASPDSDGHEPEALRAPLLLSVVAVRM